MATMTAYINVENWGADQVAAWLRGLDDVLLPYVHFFLNNGVSGRKLLLLAHQHLEGFGINKLGHQELILEAIDLLKSLHYAFETENLQSVSLQLSCRSKSLHNELQVAGAENDMNNGNVSQVKGEQQKLSVPMLASVANVIMGLKVVISWLDRAPFDSMYEIGLLRNTIVKIGLDLIADTQKDYSRQYAEDAVIKLCSMLADICDELVVNSRDPLVIQPASLELATIRKKPGEELGMHIQSSYYGIHAIGGVKDMSPAFLCGKIEKGDEVISVNHQVVVGWQLKKLVNSLKEKPKEVILLLKKRPHHINPFGNVPNKKKISQKQQAATLPSLKKRRSREGDKQPRPSLQEFISVTPPPEETYSPNVLEGPSSVGWSRSAQPKLMFPDANLSTSTACIQDGNDTDNEVFRSGSESPKFQLDIEVKPRRATVSGGSPTLERPALIIEDLDPEENEASTFSSPESMEEDRPLLLDSGNTLEVPGSPLLSANQRRHEFRSKSDNVIPLVDITGASPEQKRQDFLTQIESAQPHKIECPQPIIATPTAEDKRKSKAVKEVAGAEPGGKNLPMLMKIRKFDSVKCEQENKETGESEDRVTTKGDNDGDKVPVKEKDSTSYTVTIVGGVIQRLPTVVSQGTDKPLPESPAPVLRRAHKPGGRRMDRRVSCKDLGKGDCEGWLYKKRKTGSILSSKWHKRWFVLKNYNLYYYKVQEDLRAEGVINLPSFKVSPDTPDIKGFTGSRKMYTFKVYNNGTAFYFASDRQEDMTKWMNKMGLAAIVYAPKDSMGFHKPGSNSPSFTRRPHPIAEDVGYSESDEDPEDTPDTGSVSPSVSLRSLSSASSSLGSPASHPASPERTLTACVESSPELTRHAHQATHTGQADEYSSILRSIEKADLTLDGTNMREKRRSAITSQELLTAPSGAHMDKLKRIYLLERTIKSKELLVKAIDRLLLSEPVTHSKLEEFMGNYPDLVTQGERDSV